MRVHFETQRETKTLRQSSGQANGEKTPGIIETLDIIISDEMGERPYEAYSGGEQFRVNFAMRLALSKLLTHRAGARLQFLVVDEGFGTQDAEGRTRIIESLNAIKDDFEKISYGQAFLSHYSFTSSFVFSLFLYMGRKG